MRRTAWVIVTCLYLVAGAGCATPHANILLTTQSGGHEFRQVFPEAYVSRDAVGDYHLLLMDDSLLGNQGGDRGKPLAPAEQTPIRQIVHIHVFWTSQSGVKADNPSSTNAAVDWYVLGTGADQGSDMLHYEGAAFVRIFGSSDGATASVRNGTMKPMLVIGQMKDPIGPADISGSITAERNDTLVSNVLAELEKTTSAKQKEANVYRGGTPAPGVLPP